MLGKRVPRRDFLKTLLAGAWTQPGHDYGAVVPSGLECFAEIMGKWKEAT